jgi:hypothetical protein
MYRYNIHLGDLRGEITVSEEEVAFSGPKNFRVRKGSVTAVEKLNSLPMAKVTAQLEYYDLSGFKNTVEFRMNEIDFRSLRADLSKK